MRLAARKPLPLTTTVLWWVCGLLLALAPTLGQMHRVLHGGYGVATLPAALHAQQHNYGDDQGVPRLFGKHSATDCWLLDQWTWAHPNTTPLTPHPLAVAGPMPTPPYGHSGAIQVAAFQARAPPPSCWLG